MMKNKTKFLFALICVTVLFCLVGWTSNGQRQESPKVIWEYKLLYKADESGASAEKMLNELGAQGWELVHFRPRNEFAGGDYYFKRAK